MTALLQLDRLSITFDSDHGPVAAVRAVSLTLHQGQVLGLVGESGSGKTTLVNAMMALLPPYARTEGRLLLDGRDLAHQSEASLRRLRGNGIAAVFQDPFTALNPVVAIGRQLVAFQHHRVERSRRERWALAQDMLARVGISDPAVRMSQYPFELSGGIRQRVAIAAALLTEPRLLLADEPTTALDATTELQIVALLDEVRDLVRGATVFVSHDMGLVAQLCDQVAVMYAGELVEAGPVDQVLSRPTHPYTRALLACDPAAIETATRRLPTIPGRVPSPLAPRSGCAFQPRCGEALPQCASIRPPDLVRSDGSRALCHRAVA
ncbi:ABC transporter ATP-binding protein [Zavarzinia sp. CC-PAN008]|uniref:ABC transporter ATP-binding protein n=1 Tax=Zavarzinia sp. CC-PAN008 TaxID=3243332 RepID=UPI003F74A123